jgi:hypothetical protein
MSINSFITKLSVQTITHWANPVLDGYGGAAYDDPVEIKGRWEDRMKVINNRNGEETIATSQILTNEELQLEEIVYLGTLDSLGELDIDLDSGDVYPKPRQILQAFKIVAKDKIPLVRSATKFVRIYYLKPNWETKV